MKKAIILFSVICASATPCLHAKKGDEGVALSFKEVSNDIIAEQRFNLAEHTQGKGFGPQSPRNIDSVTGNNRRIFGAAPTAKQMNLCNIHFHKNAEHAGGQFYKYAGNGNGHGFQTGYVYSDELSKSESQPVLGNVCSGKHGSLQSGDTIEVHYVYSSAKVKPGATLGACLSDSIRNPQLRVEAQVYVLVNGKSALDFAKLTKVGQIEGLYQALNIPSDTGQAVVYEGSTTGPSYNETGSAFQVTWSVRPNVAKVATQTVGDWCNDNIFSEDHAHGVRNLVINPDLLSVIK